MVVGATVVVVVGVGDVVAEPDAPVVLVVVLVVVGGAVVVGATLVCVVVVTCGFVTLDK